MLITLLLTGKVSEVLIVFPSWSQNCSNLNSLSLKKTKGEAIIVNVFAPMCTDELHQELDRIDFVTMTIDASNIKVKLASIEDRSLLPESGVKVRLLEFRSVSGETAEILSKYLLSVLDQTKLWDKLIGFCANNCNTNFGGIERRRQNSVFYKVKDNDKRNLVGIGRTIHIVYNCLQHAVDTTPVCVESLVVKVYEFFYIYKSFVILLMFSTNDFCCTAIPDFCRCYLLWSGFLKCLKPKRGTIIRKNIVLLSFVNVLRIPSRTLSLVRL